ncbi:hypothetical protein C5167_033816 [Papaver somniferum]|uniref:Uncharacterized protein n=1 Tax=Papaver somniferum TaxID=3469 RepID=A0A4Y7KE58_PAPSO|nr:hypothetical protein C5167_033816 [Papaver somniferum]
MNRGGGGVMQVVLMEFAMVAVELGRGNRPNSVNKYVFNYVGEGNRPTCAFYGSAEATGASFTKDQRLKNCAMDANERAKLAAVAERLGREVRVFETMTTTSMSEKAYVDDMNKISCLVLAASHLCIYEFTLQVSGDDFYEFTAKDYYRTLSSKKDDKTMKPRKLREAEQAARRARITKVLRFLKNGGEESLSSYSAIVLCNSLWCLRIGCICTSRRGKWEMMTKLKTAFQLDPDDYEARCRIYVLIGYLFAGLLIKCGMLNLVDLAGFENISRSGVGEAMTEKI